MGFWRRSDSVEDQLRAAKAQPSRELIDSISADVGAHRPRTRSRITAAVALAVVSFAGVLALGGVSYATDAVQNVVNPTNNTNTSSSCSVEFPCSFTISATPKDNKLDSIDMTKGNTQIHVPGGAPQDITLDMSFFNTCTNKTDSTHFAFSFDDNPLPQGQDKTGFAINTEGAPVGVYTVTVTGVSGTQTAFDTFTLKIGGVNSC
jgi:hypothetical protein